MIGEPLNSPYDLNFQFLGFRVRVTWLFWLVTAAFGYSNCIYLDNVFGDRSPGALVLLILWIAAVFVSILIHELGHTFAMKRYNIDSHIVLYHMGGLAIPYTARQYRPGTVRRHGYGPQAQVIISLAGPIAQLILGGLTIALAVAIGYDFPLSNWLAWLFGVDPGDLRTIGDPTIEPTLYAMISFIIFPSVAWALLNLLPVLPLDGGRIAQHLLTIFQRRDGLYEATILSIVVGVLAAMWGFQNDRQFMGIMFLMLAFSNFQNLRGNIGGY